MALASSTAWSSSRARVIVATGPKVSSTNAVIPGSTSASTVGSTYQPGPSIAGRR